MIKDNEQLNKPRRSFLGKLTGGVLGLGAVSTLWFSVRSLIPNILYEPPRKVKIGLPDTFQDGVSFIDEQRIYIIRDGNTFHAISGICTHLGCTLKFSPFKNEKEITVRNLSYTSKGEFHCPCHGSKFRDEGTNFAGPAPRSLQWFSVELAPEDGQLTVDMAQKVDRDFRLVV